MVVCMSLRAAGSMGSPAASTRGTASTVMASATTSCSTYPIGASSTLATYQASTGMNASRAARSVSKPSMMDRLAVMSPAPTNTRTPLKRQRRSTRCPRGILSAQGIPAQKPSAARNAAESPR